MRSFVGMSVRPHLRVDPGLAGGFAEARALRRAKARVLVLGDDTRSTLSVVRSLGRKKIEVVLGLDNKDSVVSYSRYAVSTVFLPSNNSGTDGWKNKLRELLSSGNFDLVIPANESVYVPLCENRKEFDGLSKIAIPSALGFKYTHFKEHTLDLARHLDVPVPQTILIERKGDVQRILDGTHLKYPLVVKPSVSKKWTDGYKLEFGVHIVKNRYGLSEIVEKFLPFTSVLVGEYFEGIGVGQEFLCKDGEILLAFQHQRIHEPAGSGGSSYRKSVSLDPKLLRCSEKLLRSLNWTGVAMVEYRVGPRGGHFVFLEINGRFWGSLPLALASGVDFPFALWELYTDREVKVPPEYQTGIYARNLVNDLRWFINSRGKMIGLFLLPVYFLRIFIRFLTGKECWDVLVADDPLPAIKEIGFLIKSFFRGVIEKIQSHICSIFLKFRSPPVKKLKLLLDAKASLLFVCWGNISRSPFAECYLRVKLKERGTSGYKVESAGVYYGQGAESGRRPHPYACFVSERYGVSLASHSSKIIDASMTHEAGVIFCMSRPEYKLLRKKFPETKGKIFFLGQLHPTARRCDIEDPWGKEIDFYTHSFGLIKESIDSLFEVV